MIQEEDIFKIGYIAKSRGLQGEVELSFTDDCFDTGSAEYLVLDMDGIYVPFFWEEYRFKSDDIAIVKFENIENTEQARTIIGHSVFYPKAEVANTEDVNTLRSYKALIGYTVYLKSGEVLGKIEDVDDSSYNILLTIVNDKGVSLLIPFHNDFLIDFSIKERTLRLELPDGLLHLN